MFLKYDKTNVHAYLMCGILEDVKVSDEMRQELSIINDLIDGLKKEFVELCKRNNSKNANELIEKAKNDKALNDVIMQWMGDIYDKKNANIINLVNKFNFDHSEGYKNHVLNSKTEETQP